MGTSSRFDRPNQFCRQSFISSQELGIFLCKNVVCHDTERYFFRQAFGQRQHQGRLARAHRTTYAHGESSLFPIVSMICSV
mmetsp:Transcript_108398/g.303624  ORF Transcript_108398/g.303624 Transcript_108398/m.303624 type:complete len:81 (-) Transcript_108398:236-478(-)